MGYRLYRVADTDQAASTGIHLGEFDTFEQAVVARDDDTAQLFSVDGPGQVMIAHHQIVGPGAHGPATTHPMSTGLPRPGPHGLPTAVQVADARRWLEEIHQR